MSSREGREVRPLSDVPADLKSDVPAGQCDAAQPYLCGTCEQLGAILAIERLDGVGRGAYVGVHLVLQSALQQAVANRCVELLEGHPGVTERRGEGLLAADALTESVEAGLDAPLRHRHAQAFGLAAHQQAAHRLLPGSLRVVLGATEPCLGANGVDIRLGDSDALDLDELLLGGTRRGCRLRSAIAASCRP